MHKKHLTIFAPAKINLYLHITKKRSDNYHELDSIVCFADIGDQITIEESSFFTFHVTGPFASYLSASDCNNTTHSSNLIVRAALALSQIEKKTLNLKITLTKNLPVTSGLGGGSSNAAAIIWGLQEWWNLSKSPAYIAPLLKTLGADVPACISCQPQRLRGIGDTLTPLHINYEIPVVLINPLKPCPTQNVFVNFSGPYRNELAHNLSFKNQASFIKFLQDQNNDLLPPALKIVPEIENCLYSLQTKQGCSLARMSGSGATCFGLFDTENNAQNARDAIKTENPDWWVKTGYLNRIERY